MDNNLYYGQQLAFCQINRLLQKKGFCRFCSIDNIFTHDYGQKIRRKALNEG